MLGRKIIIRSWDIIRVGPAFRKVQELNSLITWHAAGPCLLPYSLSVLVGQWLKTHIMSQAPHQSLDGIDYAMNE
jgi:hypothetical protein